ncbi:hypothetical protein PJO50_29420, partial [Mycobacterium kansasii]
KHIDVRHHFIPHVLEERGVTLDKIHTNVNPMDMLTKVFPVENFKFCATCLGLTKAYKEDEECTRSDERGIMQGRDKRR